jgi:hypothetical protein
LLIFTAERRANSADVRGARPRTSPDPNLIPKENSYVETIFMPNPIRLEAATNGPFTPH